MILGLQFLEVEVVDPKSAQESIILEGTIEDEISIFLILREEIKKSYQVFLIFSQIF